MKTMKTKLWHGMLVFGLMLACYGWSYSQNANNPPNKIMFVNLLFEQDNNGNRSIDILSAKVTEGKLKTYKQKRYTTKSGELLLQPGKILCTLLDQSGAVMSQTMIDDPLYKELEYPGEDGHMETASVRLNSERYSIRLPFNSQYDSMKLEKIKDDLSVKEIQTVKL